MKVLLVASPPSIVVPKAIPRPLIFTLGFITCIDAVGVKRPAQKRVRSLFGLRENRRPRLSAFSRRLFVILGTNSVEEEERESFASRRRRGGLQLRATLLTTGRTLEVRGEYTFASS